MSLSFSSLTTTSQSTLKPLFDIESISTNDFSFRSSLLTIASVDGLLYDNVTASWLVPTLGNIVTTNITLPYFNHSVWCELEYQLQDLAPLGPADTVSINIGVAVGVSLALLVAAAVVVVVMAVLSKRRQMEGDNGRSRPKRSNTRSDTEFLPNEQTL
jgi:hypothetical protein